VNAERGSGARLAGAEFHRLGAAAEKDLAAFERGTGQSLQGATRLWRYGPDGIDCGGPPAKDGERVLARRCGDQLPPWKGREPWIPAGHDPHPGNFGQIAQQGLQHQVRLLDQSRWEILSGHPSTRDELVGE
jgi:hypothetical protein